MPFEVLLQGNKPLAKKLGKLSENAQRRIVRPAVRSGLSIVNKAAKQKAPRKTGLLKKSIGAAVRTYKTSGVIWGAVGPRRGYKQYIKGKWRDPVNYAPMVEHGTQHAMAKPFLRPAMDQNRHAALARIAEKVRQALIKEALKR